MPMALTAGYVWLATRAGWADVKWAQKIGRQGEAAVFLMDGLSSPLFQNAPCA